MGCVSFPNLTLQSVQTHRGYRSCYAAAKKLLLFYLFKKSTSKHFQLPCFEWAVHCATQHVQSKPCSTHSPLSLSLFRYSHLFMYSLHSLILFAFSLHSLIFYLFKDSLCLFSFSFFSLFFFLYSPFFILFILFSFSIKYSIFYFLFSFLSFSLFFSLSLLLSLCTSQSHLRLVALAAALVAAGASAKYRRPETFLTVKIES